ncbi:MAG: hypothetical protein ACOH12_11255 [Parvibaculaceae bacterium]
MTRISGRIFALLLFGLVLPVGAVSLSVSAAQAQQKYLDAVEDMPLMNGLHETGEGGMVFDKPNGRIVRTIAEGRVGLIAARRFYENTLPQLGWVRHKKLELIGDLLVFDRESERLEIEFVPVAGGTTQVRFSFEPN